MALPNRAFLKIKRNKYEIWKQCICNTYRSVAWPRSSSLEAEPEKRIQVRMLYWGRPSGERWVKEVAEVEERAKAGCGLSWTLALAWSSGEPCSVNYTMKFFLLCCDKLAFAFFMSANHWQWVVPGVGVGHDLLGAWLPFCQGEFSGKGDTCEPLVVNTYSSLRTGIQVS